MRKLKPLQDVLAITVARSYKGNYGAIKGAVPSNFIIDRAGILRYANAGGFTLPSLNALLVPLLKEKAPPDPANDTARQSPENASAPLTLDIMY